MLTLAPALLSVLSVFGTSGYSQAGEAEFERVWISSEVWTNRLQDWRLREGRMVCVEGRRRFPLRTAHFLTPSITGRGAFDIEFDVMPTETGELQAGSFAGLLIGAGGPHVDYRLTAQVHHRPAPDGGILCGIDHTGRLVLLANDRLAPGGNSWSLGGALPADALEVLAHGSHTGGFGAGLRLRVRVTEDAAPGADGRPARWRLEAEVVDLGNGTVVDRLVAEDLALARIDGGHALVSHLGPRAASGERPTGFSFGAVHRSGAEQSFAERSEGSFGPVFGVQYTVGEVLRGAERHAVWKLTAQLAPLEAGVKGRLELERKDGGFETVAYALKDPDAHTLEFRVEPFDPSREARFRVVVSYRARTSAGTFSVREASYEGLVRRDPRHGEGAGEELVIASLNCNKNYTGGLAWNSTGLWFPHAETAAAVAVHDPDLMFFAGDQIYEGDIDPAIMGPEEETLLDYLYKWSRFLWSFGELTRSRPTVTIPDDHDVYHGNLWGAGGRRARAREGVTAQDSGGYKLSPRVINAVHRTQTSHLPDAFSPEPIGAGYSTYHTVLDYGGLSFAILADRQYKSSASVTVPEGRVVNGWFQNPEFDPRAADVPGAVLLGDSQLSMLERWAADYSGDTWFKVCLSQTLFTNLATIPEKAKGGGVLPGLPLPLPGEIPAEYKLAADTDSNGWPQTGRGRAVELLRSALAVHLCGDQHLGSLVEYGLETHRDAGFAFCSPAIANTWPRRWFPPVPGANRAPGAPRTTGDFVDGFGNLMTVWAVANPVRTEREPRALYERSPGYGIVRFHRSSRSVDFEAWPRWVDPRSSSENFPGWPRRVEQLAALGPEPVGLIATLSMPKGSEAELQVFAQNPSELHYACRVRGPVTQVPVFSEGRFQISWRLAGQQVWHVHSGLEPGPLPMRFSWEQAARYK